MLSTAYRKWIELDLPVKSGSSKRIDGRFSIRDGWTLLLSCGGQSAESITVTGKHYNDSLSLLTAIALDVLQRVGPVENGVPDRRLGYAGTIGDVQAWGAHGILCSPDDVVLDTGEDDDQ